MVRGLGRCRDGKPNFQQQRRLDIEDEDDIFYTYGVTCEAVFYKDGNWNDEDNWTKYDTWTFPYSSVYVVADATIPSGCEAEVNQLTVAEEASLIVKDGGQLIYHENYDSYPVVTMEKDIAKYNSNDDGWNLIASPVTEDLVSTEVKGLIPISDTIYDLYYLKEESMKWINYKDYYGNEDPGFDLRHTKGYLYANSEGTTIKFTGPVQPYDAYNPGVAVSLTHDGQGWNLVGNPFTFNAYADKPYNVISGRTVVAYEGSDPIPPCTGIIVKAEDTGNESVTFTKDAPDGSTGNRGCLQIALVGNITRGNTLLDNAIVSFNKGSLLPKFYFGTQNANIYLPQGNEEYAIAFSEGFGEMPLNFKTTENSEYTITVNPENVEMAYLHLIDNLTGADVDLLTSPTYTFQAKTTDYASRFRLVFSASGDADGDEAPFAFIDAAGNIVITGVADACDASLQVIDMMGRVIRVCTDVARNVSTAGMVPGVYVLRLINGDDVKTQKIIVR